MLPSNTYAYNVRSNPAPAIPVAPEDALYRIDAAKIFEVTSMDGDRYVEPPAIEATSETSANPQSPAQEGTNATVPAGGPQGAPPVGAVAAVPDHVPATTAAIPAGGPQGAPPVGAAADEEMLSPQQPPLPLRSPTEQMAKEAAGIGELNFGRKTDKPIFEKQSPELHAREQRVRMHAVRAERVLNLRKGLKHLTDLEQSDEVASLLSDPPSASPTVYMDLFLKFQDLAAENSGRPVGAPMLGDWLEAIGDQWQYAEPPICSGPTWSEMLEASQHFEVPYDTAIKSDSVQNLGSLTPGEVQGDASMQRKPGKRHDHKCATPGAAI